MLVGHSKVGASNFSHRAEEKREKKEGKSGGGGVFIFFPDHSHLLIWESGTHL